VQIAATVAVSSFRSSATPDQTLSFRINRAATWPGRAPLKQRGIAISMDGRGRALDNVFIERLWRSLKYELIYPGDFATGHDLFVALENYIHFYNHRRPHQALGYRTPADLFVSRSDDRTQTDHSRNLKLLCRGSFVRPPGENM
jgi:putative transposase